MKTINRFAAVLGNVRPVCHWPGGVGVKRRGEHSYALGQSDASAGYKPAARWWLVLVLMAGHLFAADPLTEKLQRGLFEEEANRNLDAAIQEYQSVVTQADEQRKVIATALFRLGECYRKLGRTNESTAQYRRIVTDFSEQEALVKLSRPWLPPTTSPGRSSAADAEMARELSQRYAQSVAQLAELNSRIKTVGKLSYEDLLLTAPALFKDDVLNDLGKRQRASQDRIREFTAAGRDSTSKAESENLAHIGKQIIQRLDDLERKQIQEAKLLEANVQSLKDMLAQLPRDAVSAPSDGPVTQAMTQAEAEELARVKTLAKNSPDLLQSSGKDGLSQLQLAARDGHYSVVEFILAQGVNANGPERGMSPLLLAAQRGHLRIVLLLLDRGADVNVANASGHTALMSACENGFRSVVEQLLARGADVNRINNTDATPLHFTVWKRHVGLTELLLQRGANPNVLSRGASPNDSWSRGFGPSLNGVTPLHLAVYGGSASLVELLLKAAASASATNYTQVTPLHLAATAGDTNIGALLLHGGASPNVPDLDGSTPLFRAIESGHPEAVTLLLAKGADVNRPATTGNHRYTYYPTHAALSKTLAMLNAVLAAKPDLEVTNSGGQTPLLQAVLGTSTEMVDSLLAAGADPNHEVNGNVPVLNATGKGSLPMVTALLKHGANPNVMNKSSVTPLSFVQNVLKTSPPTADNARALADWEQIERALREHGANENLLRLKAITFTRPNWTAEDSKIFYRGTNDYNGYTLFELLAHVFSGQNAPAFPDLAQVTLERLEGTNAKPRELTLNIDAMVRSGQCSNDLRLEWGDRLSFPELDHPLNEGWPGISQEMRELLTRCLTRRVQVIVKQETNVVKLVQDLPNQGRSMPGGIGLPPTPLNGPAEPRPVRTERNFIGQPGGVPTLPAGPAAVSQEKPEKVLSTFRLKEVVYGANVLRASSDPTRVRVLRREPNQTNEWVIDLTKVATNTEWNGQPGKLWPRHDLWLRDGDVIEIPERP